jgi:hypothetical protein
MNTETTSTHPADVISVMNALNQRLHGGTCPGAGALGECAAAYPFDPYPGRYTANVYIWKAGQQTLKAATLAAWVAAAGGSDIVIRQDIHDPDNDTFEGFCHDGALSWIVDFCL